MRAEKKRKAADARAAKQATQAAQQAVLNPIHAMPAGQLGMAGAFMPHPSILHSSVLHFVLKARLIHCLTCLCATWACHGMSGEAAAGDMVEEGRPKKRARKAKEYIPSVGSANYAFLIILLKVRCT